MAASLPQYEETIRHKLKALNEMTVDRLNGLTGQAGRIIGEHIEQRAAATSTADATNETTLGARRRAGGPRHPCGIAPAARRVRCRSSRRCWPQFGCRSKPRASCWWFSCSCYSSTNQCATGSSASPAGPTYARATLALNDAGERLSQVSSFRSSRSISLSGWPSGWPAPSSVYRMRCSGQCSAGRDAIRPLCRSVDSRALCAVLAAAVDPGWSLAVITLGPVRGRRVDGRDSWLNHSCMVTPRDCRRCR